MGSRYLDINVIKRGSENQVEINEGFPAEVKYENYSSRKCV